MPEETKEVKVVDPKKVEAKKVRNAEKAASYTVLKELVDRQQDPKYKKALGTVRPSLYGIQIGGGGGGGSSITSKVIGRILEKTQMDEGDIFKEFKIGRKECAGHIRKALRKAEKEDRVWINFDPKTGIYKVIGKGKETPAGYTGFIPVDENIDLK